MKRQETARVIAQTKEAEGIYSLRLGVTFADEVKAGQFVSLYSSDKSRLLPRPISVCEADAENKELRIVYRVAGAGTEEFSKLAGGDEVEVLGPIGNGFPVHKAEGKQVLLIGGGIGIPPMLSCARAFAKESIHPASVTFAVGYRSDDTYLLEDLKQCAPVLISTDDGSLGVHGTVLDAIRESGKTADLIFACGPKPMLRAVRDHAEANGIECYVSMEERMACGIGVCLGCVCKTTEIDPHSGVHNARVCVDGPVFNAKEVDLS